MNLLGKIFTTGIFIASVGFLTFSIVVYSNQQNWKEIAVTSPNALKPQVANLIATNKQLTEQRDRLLAENRKERATRTTVVRALNDTILNVEVELEEKTKELIKLAGEHGATVEELRLQQTALEDSTAIFNRLLADVKNNKLDRDEQLALVSELQDRVASASGTKQKFESIRDWIAEDKIQMQSVLTSLGLTAESDVSHIPVRLKSRITAVSPTNKHLFEIEVGYDDGLRVNAVMEIYRNNEYVGRAVVRNVDRNVAVLQAMPDSLQQNIRVGDQVATVLGSNDLKKLDLIRQSRADLSPTSYIAD
ncbi:MAG: hypothetical protein NXI22_12630 [bacterium]|nr:hypothetical protein [bacterium]